MVSKGGSRQRLRLSVLYMHICICMYLEFTERCVSIEQNVENAGGSGNKYVFRGVREKQEKEGVPGVCLCTAFIQQNSCKFSLTSHYALAALLYSRVA